MGAETVNTGDPAKEGATPEDIKADLQAQLDALNAKNKKEEGSGGASNDTPEVPEKFRKEDGSPDFNKLLSSYTELESKLGSGKSSDDEGDSADDKQDGLKIEPADDDKKSDDPEIAGVQDFVKSKGLDWDALAQEWDENGGSFKPETYEKMGLPKGMVDDFIQTKRENMEVTQAKAVEIENRVKERVGGEDAFAKMARWAAQTKWDGLDLYNEDINSGSEKKMLRGVQSLKDAYVKANGQAPEVKVEGDPVAPLGGDSYADWSEVQEDMSKPEYQKSAAFREKVANKLARSNIR